LICNLSCCVLKSTTNTGIKFPDTEESAIREKDLRTITKSVT
jgi:hypothetical protein